VGLHGGSCAISCNSLSSLFEDVDLSFIHELDKMIVYPKYEKKGV
jgi:hypothetical protein